MYEEIYSPYKMVNHLDRIRMIKNGKIPAPVTAQIDLCNMCQLNCSFCIYRNAGMEVEGLKFDRTKIIETERMMKLLEEMKEVGVKAVEYSVRGDEIIMLSLIHI